VLVTASVADSSVGVEDNPATRFNAWSDGEPGSTKSARILCPVSTGEIEGQPATRRYDSEFSLATGTRSPPRSTMTSSPEKGSSSDHILGFARSLLSHRLGGRHKPHEVYQTSTIVSLVEGLYDGNVPYRDVMRHGDFGVGTFNALDGEMVALDGNFYHLRHDGTVSPVSADDLTPFAVVTRFRPNIDQTEEGTLTRKQCEEVVHHLTPSDNLSTRCASTAASAPCWRGRCRSKRSPTLVSPTRPRRSPP